MALHWVLHILFFLQIMIYSWPFSFNGKTASVYSTNIHSFALFFYKEVENRNDFGLLSAMQEKKPINRHVHWKDAVVPCLWEAAHETGCQYASLCHLYPFLKKGCLLMKLNETINKDQKHIKNKIQFRFIVYLKCEGGMSVKLMFIFLNKCSMSTATSYLRH